MILVSALFGYWNEYGNLQDDLQHFSDWAPQTIGSISKPRNAKRLRSNLAMPLYMEQT